GLADLTVANNQFALPASDRHHRIDGLLSRLYRLVHRLACDHARRNLFDRRGLVRTEIALAVDGDTQRIDHSTEQRFTHGHFQHLAGGTDFTALRDVPVIPHDHSTNRVTLEVQCQTVGTAREFEHFTLHGAA